MIDNLYDKRTGERVTVYAVSEDSNGYPKFLIREKNRWVWQSAKYYITEKEKQYIDYEHVKKDLLDYGCIEHNGEINYCKTCVYIKNGCRKAYTKVLK